MKRQERTRRIGAVLVLAILMVMTLTITSFGAKAFTIIETTPKNGATGMAIENMGVKVNFSEDVYTKDKEVQEANAALCQLTDPDGKEIPSKVVFSSKDPKVMLVLADTDSDSKQTIEGKTEYTLTIKEDFVSADGEELTLESDSESYDVKGGDVSITFETLNPRTTTFISMGMMAVMIGAMLFFTMRETRKSAEDDKKKKTTYEPVNPYKEAKRTGKSVEEVVAAEQKKKEKFAEKEAKRARQREENKQEIASDNLRVPRPRPISEAGSTYRAPKN